MNRSKIRYLSTEKIPKNPRNSAYICQFKTLNMAAVSFLSHKSKVVFDLANLRIELNPLDGDDFSEVN